MAVELSAIKINPESHLILDQPLLRLPHELARRNFKSVQRIVEREKDYIIPALKETANATLSGSQAPEAAVASLDAMINRLQGLKKKMETLRTEEQRIMEQTAKRIDHLNSLYTIGSFADVQYDRWAQIRLNRLLVDHMLRSGYLKSAKILTKTRDIADLVDVEVFAHCQRIAESLRKGETKEALQWCGENKVALKKTGNKLDFELRMQQYVELLAAGDVTEARQHAKKYITPHSETHKAEILRAAGLMVFPPDTELEPYKSMYSQDRWQQLSDLFVRTHHDLFSLSSHPLLQIALSAGISALKTPACHTSDKSVISSMHLVGRSICPVCSSELNELSRHMPYAHHTKSSVDSDPVVLPNNRVWGRSRLMALSKRTGTEMPMIKDIATGEQFHMNDMQKVFIS